MALGFRDGLHSAREASFKVGTTMRLQRSRIPRSLYGARPEPRVAEFLDTIADEGIGLAVITVWEILNGIGQLAPGQRRETLAERFQLLLDDFFEDRIFDWSAADARACALIMEEKRRQGEPLDSHLPDAMLAGTARHRDLTIVTRNEREFRNTDVRVVNPWSDADDTI